MKVVFERFSFSCNLKKIFVSSQRIRNSISGYTCLNGYCLIKEYSLVGSNYILCNCNLFVPMYDGTC